MVVAENEAIQTYSLLDDGVVVWVLRRNRPPIHFVITVPREQIRRTITRLRASFSETGGRLERFDAAASEELFGWLLKAPLEVLPEGTRIKVIADAELSSIPFEILGQTRDGTVVYATERHTFTYAASASVLHHQRRSDQGRASRAGAQRLLVVGDPVYDVSDPRGSRAGAPATRQQDAIKRYSRDSFTRLPSTSEEAAAIAAAVGRSSLSDVRVGYEASEARIKRLDLATYRYLHFATHGILSGDLPYLQQPALVLTQVGDLEGEDGFLTMSEVLRMVLNADLTTLSACKTGLGERVSGEGAMSLARAFQFAGSRAVLVSLWSVDDEATAKLMGAFYGHLSKGVAPAIALDRAKREVRTVKRWAHPYFWGGFVLFTPD
jgi:CHAT domain-containing protein